MFYGSRFPDFYDFNARSRAARFVTIGPSLTRQSELNDADINVLVRRFNVTGVLPGAALPPTFGDFTGVDDFLSAQLKLREAQASFDSLPAEIRAKFQNSPAKLIKWLGDPANDDESRALGLRNKKAPEAAAVPAAAASGAAPPPVAAAAGPAK